MYVFQTELYNICLARAKEKWNAFVAPTAATETESEGDCYTFFQAHGTFVSFLSLLLE